MNQRALLLWVGGFIGVGLLYAAYKGKLNPITAVSSALQGGTSTPTNGVAPAQPAKAGVAGIVGSGVTQSNGIWYVADKYGNPAQQVDGVYQGTPNNYIPYQAV